jgi:hypothetical protein
LNETEYWNFTPAQLAALAEAHAQKEEKTDGRLASVLHFFANIHRDSRKPPIPFSTFFKPRKERKQTGWKEQKAYLKSALGKGE